MDEWFLPLDLQIDIALLEEVKDLALWLAEEQAVAARQDYDAGVVILAVPLKVSGSVLFGAALYRIIPVRDVGGFIIYAQMRLRHDVEEVGAAFFHDDIYVEVKDAVEYAEIIEQLELFPVRRI
jgi:hypothetical protein